MKLTSNIITTASVSVLVVAMMLAAIFNQQARINQAASRDLVVHSYQILNMLESIHSMLKDAETGQRGYLLTFDESYLEPYNHTSDSVEEAFRNLTQLTSDNPQQLSKIKQLSTASSKKLSELKRTIELGRTQGFDAAVAVVKSNQGKNAMDEIREIIGDMIKIENDHLMDRTVKLEQDTALVSIVSLFFSSFAIMALVVLAFLLQRFLRARQQAETETEKQKSFLQLVLDTMSDGLVVADLQGNFILTNPAAQQLVGKLGDSPPSEWASKFGLFKSEEGDLYPSGELPLARALRGESSEDVEIFVRNAQNPNGRWISVNGRTLGHGTDNMTGGLVVMRDISDRKGAERRVSEFYSTVSHELRTPLTSIRGSLGLIEGGLAGSISDKGLKLIKIARSESDRLIRLINDILDLRKIEAGKLELKRTAINCQALIRQAIEAIRGMSESSGVQVSPRFNTNGQVECDHDRIIQVLTNLISNAIKFSSTGGEVVVDLDATLDGAMRFSVIDKGAGIPADQMHKLFGKFQQLDQSDTRKKEGTGLGLAITKAIVEEHGGRLGVESEVGRGSIFWFELPASKLAVSATVSNKQHTLGNHIRPAVVVEDDDNIAEILITHLAHDGLQVLRAKTLAEAERILQQHNPLVVILDLTLPDGDGLDLLQKLTADEAKRDVPVIVVTGRDTQGQPTFGHPALIDWITKPFTESRLQKAINSARQQVGPARVLLVEDDPSTREILKEQLDSLKVKCFEAADGAEAISTFRATNPDLIILDLVMPAPDGFAVVDILSKEENGLKPLIIYTALDLTEQQKVKLKLGLTGYLTKGNTTEKQLLQMVRQLLDGLVTNGPQVGDNNTD